jgi:ABC-type multidrug transport system fused ATPase/permease subunit
LTEATSNVGNERADWPQTVQEVRNIRAAAGMDFVIIAPAPLMFGLTRGHAKGYKFSAVRMSQLIEVAELRKSYGESIAVDGVSFTAQPGEIFGLLGPNGAGKPPPSAASAACSWQASDT